MKPEPIVPAALVEKCGPNTAGTETDRGTGVSEAQKAAQAGDQWFSDVADAARPVHYREAAASLRKLGHVEAAERLESFVKDLEDGE
jgi:hypothetical protein